MSSDATAPVRVREVSRAMVATKKKKTVEKKPAADEEKAVDSKPVPASEQDEIDYSKPIRVK